MQRPLLGLTLLLLLTAVPAAAVVQNLEKWNNQCQEFVGPGLHGLCCAGGGGGCCDWNGEGNPEGVVVAKYACDVYRDRTSRLQYRFWGTAGTSAGWAPVANTTPTPTATATRTATPTPTTTPTPTPTATP